jgi:hypothetical protein
MARPPPPPPPGPGLMPRPPRKSLSALIDVCKLCLVISTSFPSSQASAEKSSSPMSPMLLSQIHQGAQLRKTEVRDRSAPVIECNIIVF